MKEKTVKKKEFYKQCEECKKQIKGTSKEMARANYKAHKYFKHKKEE